MPGTGRARSALAYARMAKKTDLEEMLVKAGATPEPEKEEKPKKEAGKAKAPAGKPAQPQTGKQPR